MEITDLFFPLIVIVVTVVVNSLVVWLAGKTLVGSEKAKFSDALWIVILNAVISGILGVFISGFIGAIVILIVYLLLIKHFFDCGWGKAIIIAILAVIISVIISFVLGIIFAVTLFVL
jgi:hypothetical protein